MNDALNKDDTRDKQIAICFTQGHDEKLVIEEVQHEGLVDMLFRSEYKLGKIETWVSWQRLSGYQVLVIGCPQENNFKDEEIKTIINFVKDGGGLFLINDEGGDALSGSNLNAIASQFGFVFNPDLVKDETSFTQKPEYVKIKDFQKHF
ncbi:MAG: hypothetical protein ACTSVI_15900, partial [Promethearchaeota archaeon]